MNKQKIFISSVQSEFSSERKLLFDYISRDAEAIVNAVAHRDYNSTGSV